MRHLRTLVLDNASALENPEFANLTALTTICITFPWNLLDLATLLRLPRLAHLTTFAPYESHQPSAGTASIVLPSYIKSLTFAVASPPFDTIILPSASAFVALEELLITNGSGLTDLPNHIDYLLPSLRKLTFRKCSSLVHLPENFASLSRLETLIFYDCGLLTLPDSFGDLPALKLLVLEFVPLWGLPPSFCDLTSLEALFLAGCDELRQLPAGFSRLTALKALCITECVFPLPDDVGALLTYCEQLSSLPAGLPPSLETLCLGPFREGSSHEVDIGHLTQLRVLKLTRVGVCCGPAVSGRVLCLQELEQLEMRVKGDIRELPVTLALVRLPRLRSLLIQAPGICSLPENMAAALPDLQQLELLSWSPEELPECIWELSSLMSLKINAPQLLALLQGMSCLSRLRKLELIRCKALQHLPDFLTQLHRLSLRSTLLSSVPEEFVLLD
ncbi:unnamed protein product [Closterium sp. Naga37s-1]|nr:unnamed protein product [Closterium sp. Naga37s-1]